MLVFAVFTACPSFQCKCFFLINHLGQDILINYQHSKATLKQLYMLIFKGFFDIGL